MRWRNICTPNKSFHRTDDRMLSTQAQLSQQTRIQNDRPESLCIENDRRKLIKETNVWPNTIHVHIRRNKEKYGTSGCMVGPQYVLTAAHCVFNKNKKEFVNKITVRPARNGESAPFGR